MGFYLVTGGCGFIGSHLVDALAYAGHRVRVLDDLSTGKVENVSVPVELLVGDAGDRETVARAMAGVDGCFHLAAVASVVRANEDWCGTHRANLTATVNVMDAARSVRCQVPVVYASSAAVYGDNPAVPLDEDATTRPLTAYGADKLGCELHARVAGQVHGVPTSGLRFFNVYGPRQDPSSPYSGVISIFADRMARGEGITVFGDGMQERDFVYVGDVVRHLIAGMEHADTDAAVYNVCTGRATTILELARTIGRVVGRQPMIEHGEPRSGDIRRSLGTPALAAARLGVRSDVILEEGLAVLFRAMDALAA